MQLCVVMKFIKTTGRLLLAGVARLVFAGYSNLDRWLKPTYPRNHNDKELNFTAAIDSQDWNVNTKILSVSINERKAGKDEQRLVAPIVFVLQHSNVSFNTTCIFA
jgi:hypothetical protein